jgi:hypothetical protein
LGCACWQKLAALGLTNQLTSGSRIRRCEATGGLNKEKSSKPSAMAGDMANSAVLSKRIGQEFFFNAHPVLPVKAHSL